jgi:DNA-binding SARP family transcriptional activator
MLDEAQALELSSQFRGLGHLVEAKLAIRDGNPRAAREIGKKFIIGRPSDQPGFKARQLAVIAHSAVASGDQDAAALVAEARQQAILQGSILWERYCQVLSALLTKRQAALPGLIKRLPERELTVVCPFAESVCEALVDLDAASTEAVRALCAAFPDRWLPPLRYEVRNAGSRSRWAAGEILDQVGTQEDIPTLRSLARSAKGSARKATLGRSLARRLAPRFLIEDLGRVEVTTDATGVPASGVRRKVLAMLCFLLTRPRFSATRDEVIDALWPELSPDVAVNSLNQTVYFLRRVFEPGYVEDLSAGYVHHNSDMLWLDRELVSSRSARCLAILDTLGPRPDPASVHELSLEYKDRFALDFAYEEWAVPFRTSLHAGYLRVMEAAVTEGMANGHHDRAIELARRALDRDGSVESLELALLRLYRATGAHAAAAEQYAHYAAVLRDELGVDPPPLSAI